MAKTGAESVFTASLDRFIPSRQVLIDAAALQVKQENKQSRDLTGAFRTPGLRYAFWGAFDGHWRGVYQTLRARRLEGI